MYELYFWNYRKRIYEHNKHITFYCESKTETFIIIPLYHNVYIRSAYVRLVVPIPVLCLFVRLGCVSVICVGRKGLG